MSEVRQAGVPKEWGGPCTEGDASANNDLRTGAMMCNPERVEQALAAGACANADSDGQGTAIIKAAASTMDPLKAQAIAEMLINAGCDCNAITQNGYTALHRAAEYNQNWEILQMLCKAGGGT